MELIEISFIFFFYFYKIMIKNVWIINEFFKWAIFFKCMLVFYLNVYLKVINFIDNWIIVIITKVI